ncbi:hypothetical protein ABZ498_11465 [Streptomyces lavendulocolor]|uniref:DUF7144 family membrane protein n=1 Tax=Streptomyces lavendulocolor TaxID=67316 RepID=UPI0033DC762F
MTAMHTRPAHAARQDWATGLTAFAAVMLFVAGVLAVFRSIMALAEDDIFVTTPDYVFAFDLTTWGWIHLVLGAIAMVVGLGLLRISTWARVAGVVVAGLVIMSNFLSLPYYPVWSMVMIALSGLVIWALCVVRGDNLFGPYEEEGAPRE